MRFKEIQGLRPLTEFEGFVTKMYLIVLYYEFKTKLVSLKHNVRENPRVAGL